MNFNDFNFHNLELKDRILMLAVPGGDSKKIEVSDLMGILTKAAEMALENEDIYRRSLSDARHMIEKLISNENRMKAEIKSLYDKQTHFDITCNSYEALINTLHKQLEEALL